MPPKGLRGGPRPFDLQGHAGETVSLLEDFVVGGREAALAGADDADGAVVGVDAAGLEELGDGGSGVECVAFGIIAQQLSRFAAALASKTARSPKEIGGPR